MRDVRPILSLSVLGFAAFLFPTPAMAFVTLSGKVTDQNGVGIFGVQIDFVDSCTGVTAGATGNVSSSTGTFTATVNPGIYDLEFVPPAGSLFTANRMRDFDLTISKTLPPLVLPYGVTVSGHVTDAGGSPLSNVYLHFLPPGSTDRIFTVRDQTDGSGNYAVVISTGTYDLHYGPPSGTRFLTLVRPSVSIPGNIALPTVSLQTGLLVSGRVLDASTGTPVINVNINAIDNLLGTSLPLSHDRTDASGLYTVVVPAGTYRFDTKPKKCTLLIAQESATTTVSADLTLPDVSLQLGVLVQGNVTDTRGMPIFDVNTNYFIGSPGTQILTSDDHTDAAGVYSAVVPAVAPPGTYTIHYAPPVGVKLAGIERTGVTINSPTTLPPVQLSDGFFVSGKTVNPNGTPLAAVDLDFFAAGTTTAIYTPHDNSDPTGLFKVVEVPGSYDIWFHSTSTNDLQILKGIAVGGDLSLGNVVISVPGYVVSGRITNPGGSPVVNADLDFYDYYTGEKVDTPHDNTDTNGNYSLVVPARLYNVKVVPPLGASLETGWISGVSITSNTSGVNAVLRSAVTVSGTVSSSGGAVANVDLNFFQSATGIQQVTSRDNSATNGTFGVLIFPGTYDITFTPPATAGLAPAQLNGVTISGDINLGTIFLDSAATPSIASISPNTGPGSGGTAVTILGSNFQLGATATLGALNLLSIKVVNSGRIDAVTPGRPVTAQSTVNLAVTNRGAASAATLTNAFTYTPPALPVTLSVAPASPSVVLSWPATGQAFYTIYRSTTPNLFGQPQILATTTSTSFTDVGALEDGVTYFYKVE